MLTTKDRTPAAWRSQVPLEVRSLAREAADLKGEWESIGTKGKARGPKQAGDQFLGSEALQTRQC